ncbi:MAG: L,D-transpeptidase, partial [Desulfobulbaceae bacterium]|nr:L,D-transpeptidase [Desulfobulbaceae bacterium]
MQMECCRIFTLYLVNLLNKIRVVISRIADRRPFGEKGACARLTRTALILISLLCVVPLIHFGAVFSYSATSRGFSPQDVSAGHSFDGIISVFFYKDPVHIIFVEKDKQLLSVLEYDNGLRVVAQYLCATGENPGRKRVIGDSRTPVGIYFITKIYNDSKITIFGKRAFHLDYPNAFDLAEGRNGNGIYIHGINKPLTPKSTNGCVTLRNQDLDELVQFLEVDITPVIIVENRDFFLNGLGRQLSGHDFELVRKLVLPREIDPDLAEFDYLFLLNSGTQAVAVGEFFQQKDNVSGISGFGRSYFEFLPDEIWTTRERVWTTSPVQIVTASLAPELKKSPPLFNEPMLLASNLTKLPKRAAEVPEPHLEINSAAELKNRDLPSDKLHQYGSHEPVRSVVKEIPASLPVKKPEPAPSVPSYPKDRRMVVEFVEKWRNAWQSKEIDVYMSCYHETFSAGNKNRSGWRRHKERLAGKYKFIKVEISDIKVNWTQNGAEASFRQAYRSDMYSADG